MVSESFLRVFGGFLRFLKGCLKKTAVIFLIVESSSHLAEPTSNVAEFSSHEAVSSSHISESSSHVAAESSSHHSNGIWQVSSSNPAAI
jgi:hypothetical protein